MLSLYLCLLSHMYSSLCLIKIFIEVPPGCVLLFVGTKVRSMLWKTVPKRLCLTPALFTFQQKAVVVLFYFNGAECLCVFKTPLVRPVVLIYLETRTLT